MKRWRDIFALSAIDIALWDLAAMPLTGRPGGSWTERFHTRLEATLYPDFISPVEGGRFRVPAGPGLGAEPDPDVIRDYRVAD